jgi:hypothetical protein
MTTCTFHTFQVSNFPGFRKLQTTHENANFLGVKKKFLKFLTWLMPSVDVEFKLLQKHVFFAKIKNKILKKI